MIITTDIGGGMGNQMFMMSHAIAQSWKYNRTAQFILQDPGYVGRHPNLYVDNVYRNINFVSGINDPLIKIIETWGETPDISGINTSIIFEGYFQGTKHFLGYDNEIRNLFSPTNDFIEYLESVYPQIKNKNTLSVHIRRGDYLQISNILPTVDVSYIDESIKQHGKYDTLFVFSDDKQWARENVKHPNIIIVDVLTDWSELWLMSLCKHNIICNSTYSWWGAFLNKNPNKKVYLPSLWFGPNAGRGLVHETISEPTWIEIPVEYNNGTLLCK